MLPPMETTSDHPPYQSASHSLETHREKIFEIFEQLHVGVVRVLREDAPIRLPDLYDIEFVVELPRLVGLMGLLSTETALEDLLGQRVYIHDLLVDCEDNRIARKESSPL
jgi:hypothetical protein